MKKEPCGVCHGLACPSCNYTGMVDVQDGERSACDNQITVDWSKVAFPEYYARDNQVVMTLCSDKRPRDHRTLIGVIKSDIGHDRWWSVMSGIGLCGLTYHSKPTASRVVWSMSELFKKDEVVAWIDHETGETGWFTVSEAKEDWSNRKLELHRRATEHPFEISVSTYESIVSTLDSLRLTSRVLRKDRDGKVYFCDIPVEITP